MRFEGIYCFDRGVVRFAIFPTGAGGPRVLADIRKKRLQRSSRYAVVATPGCKVAPPTSTLLARQRLKNGRRTPVPKCAWSRRTSALRKT
jgi:hypothetical protein